MPNGDGDGAGSDGDTGRDHADDHGGGGHSGKGYGEDWWSGAGDDWRSSGKLVVKLIFSICFFLVLCFPFIAF